MSTKKQPKPRKVNRYEQRKLRKQLANKGKGLVQGHQLGLRNPLAMTHYPHCIKDEWRFESKVSSDGSGAFSQYFSLRNPLNAVNGSGTYPRAPGFANLYDEYQIERLTVVFDPLQLQVQTGRIGMAVDYDSIPSGTYTFSDLRDNEYLRDFRALNQIAYEAHEVPLTQGTYRGTSSTIHTKGWYDFNSPPEEGFVAMAGEFFTPNAAVGMVLLTMTVRMRRRRTINLTREARFEQEGKVIAPINPQFQFPPALRVPNPVRPSAPL